MAVEKYTVHDGVFVHSGTRASIKDTPRKDFEAGLKKALEESAQRGSTEHILKQLEGYARAKLEAPTIKKKKGQRPGSFQGELESDTRQRRDCEKLLEEISFLKTISGRKETDKDFLMAQFFYLGVLAQHADIRPVEPNFFRGTKTIGGASEGGTSTVKLHRQEKDTKYRTWQENAEKIKQEKPSYKRWRIAGILAEKYRNKPELQAEQDTIYRIIKV
jgi:hypothetical protein